MTRWFRGAGMIPVWLMAGCMTAGRCPYCHQPVAPAIDPNAVPLARPSQVLASPPPSGPRPPVMQAAPTAPITAPPAFHGHYVVPGQNLVMPPPPFPQATAPLAMIPAKPASETAPPPVAPPPVSPPPANPVPAVLATNNPTPAHSVARAPSSPASSAARLAGLGPAIPATLENKSSPGGQAAVQLVSTLKPSLPAQADPEPGKEKTSTTTNGTSKVEVAAVGKVEKPASVSPPATKPPIHRLDHAADYSWVQGRLTRVHSRGGYWQVRYAGLDQSDRHGGQVILVGSATEGLKEGDMVRVRGSVLGYDGKLRGTKYRATGIQLVDPPSGMLAN